ncbi:ATP-binding protein [Thiomicrorhabdus sp.]|uniref:HD domain-containing protein n=1 Tax=Thiomicrorhabdus sp. TaxID=2039724 RepID=UPI002AA7F426|nr:ATP-binding protein [Thiomicrorhabdus sp.]
MSDALQKHLKNKATEQEQLSILLSQWDFDKKLVPKALQNVGQLFPHFSLHDQSHSDQILINIERILGPNRISQLSATDTWLLLEAAYWHDTGMIIAYSTMDEDIHENPDFKEYIREVANDTSNELSQFAHFFNSQDLSKAFIGAKDPLDAINKLRFLMAEWYRRPHANKSEKTVNNPISELNLNSPRTELIPNRLFKLLGKICRIHGESFETLLAELDYKEAGISNDDCHPRFIACLLRLGDLLDIDDNRFCPVMQRLVGNNRPSLTKAHEDKHSSIKHLRIDPERIEITAMTETESGYLEQWKWFDWIKKEIQQQMSQWRDITPSPEFGLLPTIGKIKVEIQDKKLILSEGKRPEFSLNSNGVMRLLKGQNFYNQNDTIRELLQNSVDATLIRSWLENKAFDDNKIKDYPDEDSPSYFERFPIEISFNREREAEDKSKVIWSVTIKDQGIGISSEDLKFVLQVGGSSSNKARQKIINDMPEWLRPSGTFGIGFQSVFMWTDKVKILTQSSYDNDQLKIEVNNPNGVLQGLATIELISNTKHIKKLGTELTFEIEVDKTPKNISYRYGSLVEKAYSENDWFLEQELPAKIISLVDEASDFSQGSLIRIDINYNSTKYQTELPTHNKSKNFIQATNSFSKLYLENERDIRYRSSLSYRGQNIEKFNSVYDFFAIELDLYSGKASDWVTISRNDLTELGKQNINSVVKKNLGYWIKQNGSMISSKPHIKARVSAICHMWKDDIDIDPDWIHISNKYKSDWTAFEGTYEGNTEYHSIKNSMKVGVKLILDHIQANETLDDNKVFFFNELNSRESLFITELWLKEWIDTSENNGIRYSTVEYKDDNSKQTRLIRIAELIQISESQSKVQISDDELVKFIEISLKTSFQSFRLFIPLFDYFNGIKNLEKLVMTNTVIHGHFENVIPYSPEKSILLPFFVLIKDRKPKLNLERFDDFIDAVKNKLPEELPVQQIKEIYEEVIKYFDTLMTDSNIWKDMRNPS